jgi:branched-chain amino acid transport system substrate-binding protein
MRRSYSRRSYIQTGIAALGTAAVAGCQGSGSNSEWQNTVGFTIPKSGPQGFLGELLEEGGQIAISDFNEAHDTDVELRIEDSEGTIERARTVVQRLIDDKVPVAGGSISSDVTLAIRELVESEELPYITPFGTNTDVTKPGTEFTFRNGSPNNVQLVSGYLQYLQENDVSSIAILAADYSFGRTIVETLRALAPEFDIEINSYSLIPLGT